jgi:glycosyltransferase involved in cell wall biosynthesis
MRVLELIDSATVGGAEENTALLARELSRRSHTVLLASPEGPYTARFDALRGEGVETARLPLRGPLLAASRELRALIATWKPDLVHSHMLRADAASAMQGARVQYLRASSVHNMFKLEVPSLPRRTLYRMLATWSYRRMDAVLPVSDHVGEYLADYLRVPRAKLRTVPNGIDAEGFRARAAASSGALPATPPALGARVVLTVGRLDHNKGQELVLRAAAALARPDLQVWFAGTGPREAELRALARDLRIACALLGRRDDVPALMRRADVVVQPSRWEALPNTVLEAMALARPVVATAAGGTPEAVRDGVTGWLVPVDDVEALAEAIGAALDDPLAASARGEAGRRLVDERFTIGRAAELLLQHPHLARRLPAH